MVVQCWSGFHPWSKWQISLGSTMNCRKGQDYLFMTGKSSTAKSAMPVGHFRSDIAGLILSRSQQFLPWICPMRIICDSVSVNTALSRRKAQQLSYCVQNRWSQCPFTLVSLRTCEEEFAPRHRRSAAFEQTTSSWTIRWWNLMYDAVLWALSTCDKHRGQWDQKEEQTLTR